jgi:hypothetical protein
LLDRAVIALKSNEATALHAFSDPNSKQFHDRGVPCYKQFVSCATSALGHKRTSEQVHIMSALPHKADIRFVANNTGRAEVVRRLRPGCCVILFVHSAEG